MPAKFNPSLNYPTTFGVVALHFAFESMKQSYSSLLKLPAKTDHHKDGKKSILCRWPQLVMLLYIYCTFRLTVWLQKS